MCRDLPTNFTYMRRLGRLLLVFSFLAMVLVPTLALARPRSGGSFSGRGGFRSPSGSYSRGPARAPASRGPNVVVFPGFGWGFLPFGLGGGSMLGTLMMVGVLGLGAVMVMRAVRRSQARNRGQSFYGQADDDDSAYDDEVAVAPGRSFVYKLQLGLGRSARGIQQRLEQFAAEGDTGSEAGLAHLLSQTALELMRERHSIRYASIEAAGPLSMTNGETKLNSLALAERSRFQVERVRGAEGKVRRSEVSGARTDEVLEYLLVTVVLATRTPLADTSKLGGKPPEREQLEAVLAELGGVSPSGLLGLEVIWTPADPEDAMTEAELLLHYPDLRAV